MHRSRGGYTLVEVMIVLAVSMVLFVSAWGLVSGRQQKVEFSSGMQEIHAKIQSVISDVSNGYFQNANDLECKTIPRPLLPPGTSNPRPSVSPGSIDKDTGDYTPECVFFGEAIQFGDDGIWDRFVIHTILSNATITAGAQTTHVDTLRPAYLNSNLVLPTAIPLFRENYQSPWGIEYMAGSSSESKVNAIAFIGGFSQGLNNTTSSEGGVSSVTPIALPIDPSTTPTASDVEDAIDRPHNYLNMATGEIQSFTTKTMCFTDGAQIAAIVFKQNTAGQLTTELQFNPTLC